MLSPTKAPKTCRKPRQRQAPVSPYGLTGCNESCLMWRRCRSERLWAGPELLPCETALDDEIGLEYEPGELTLWPTIRLDFCNEGKVLTQGQIVV